ncbi:isochorismatase family protein [Phenylobacterium sp.]|uniref:isochorismatase family protein n=1 Tax=Phenylobacterium sp. TaxID=1871053 RepID=UPI003983A6D8
MTYEALTENYARAGFGGRLAFGARPALLIIDSVEAYVRPDAPLYADQDGALENMVRLADAAREAGAPVVFTNVVYQAGGLDGGVFYRKVPALKLFDQGSALAAFPERLKPQSGEIVVSKQYASAFFGTSLASTLRAIGVDTVVMGGYSTSGCVRASALDTVQHGFIPFVVREACGDRDPGPHEASLFDLQAKYAEVVGVEEALRLIRDSASARRQAGRLTADG